MSELEPQHPPAPAEPLHGGALLRERRIASGMHIVGLSAVLKVPVARLEALEAGRFDELPDLIFARALASSVCRVLKTDPAPILAALPASRSTVPESPPTAAIEPPKPLRNPGLPMGGHAARRQRRLWVLVLTLLVLALLASGAWWWQQPTGDAMAPAADAVQASPVAQPLPMPVPPAADATPVAPAVTQGTALAASPAAATTPDTVPAQAPTTTALAASAAPAATPAAEPVLRLSATQVTWVQVLGASGALRLERTLQPGESLDAFDDLPLQVVVGRADALEVKVRGQRFDLAPYTRNQVARFQVR